MCCVFDASQPFETAIGARYMLKRQHRDAPDVVVELFKGRFQPFYAENACQIRNSPKTQLSSQVKEVNVIGG